MSSNSILAASFATLLVAACSGSETAQSPETPTATEAPATLPTSDEARTLIETSQPFGDHEFTYSSWSLPLDREITHETQLAMARDLENAGWIRLRGGRVELTEKARGDKRFLERPNGSLDIVPLAKKEIVEVSSVEPAEDGARAIVRWRWIPNEVGSAFTTGPAKTRFDQEQIAEVTLRENPQGEWEVWSVKAVPR